MTSSAISALAETATSLAAAQIVSELVVNGRRSQATTPLSKAAALVLLSQGVSVAAHRVLPIVHAPAGVVARLALLLTAHFFAIGVDCRSRDPGLSLRDFCAQLGKVVVYVLPAYPLLVVLGSALLFVSTSTLQWLVDIGSLRWLVDIGSLHAPFVFVHIRLRQTIARGSALLPVVRDAAFYLDTAEMREQRVRQFLSSRR